MGWREAGAPTHSARMAEKISLIPTIPSGSHPAPTLEHHYPHGRNRPEYPRRLLHPQDAWRLPRLLVTPVRTVACGRSTLFPSRPTTESNLHTQGIFLTIAWAALTSLHRYWVTTNTWHNHLPARAPVHRLRPRTCPLFLMLELDGGIGIEVCSGALCSTTTQSQVLAEPYIGKASRTDTAVQHEQHQTTKVTIRRSTTDPQSLGCDI